MYTHFYLASTQSSSTVQIKGSCNHRMCTKYILIRPIVKHQLVLLRNYASGRLMKVTGQMVLNFMELVNGNFKTALCPRTALKTASLI
jgi:hypothetical protein